jgi:hypothetical protein
MDPLDLSNNNSNNNDLSKGRVEKLQEKLYSPNTQFQIRSRQNLKRQIDEVPPAWDDVENDSFAQSVSKNKVSVFTKIVFFSFVFFIASLGFVFYKFNGNNVATRSNSVEVTVIGPVAVSGGEPMSFDIIVQNRNAFEINTVDLVIEYPEGTKTADLVNNLPRLREGIGDIPANTLVKKTYSAALFGAEGDQKNIQARVEYRVPNSNAIFESRKNFELVLQSSPVRLVVDTVGEITSGQPLSFNITVSSNSNTDIENVLVTADYPFGFNFSQSTILPTKGNNIWLFDKLSPQESKTFTIRGSLVGQNNEERVFRWNIGLADLDNKDDFRVKFTTIPKSITLIRPFLAMDISVDGDFGADLVRQGARQMSGRLTFTNNTGSIISDPEIVLKLDGQVLDDPSVDLETGFFNSADNTITWNKVTNKEFTEIPVGQSRTFAFNFKSKPLATRQAVFKNPEIVLNASIIGRRLGERNVPENIKVDSLKRIKFQSDVILRAITSYSGEPFQNTGPFPPRVQQDTTYTVTLDLTNSSNLINRGKVRVVLPPYVRWNNVYSPSSEKVTYISSTRTVEWDLGDVREHVGFIDPARTIAIQLTFTPSSTQVGQSPPLMISPTFTGFDSFTQTDISFSAEEPTIDLGRLGDLDTAKVVQ